MYDKSFKNFRVGVLGLARSGIAAANLARKCGAKVLISEIRPLSECRKQLALLDSGVETEFGGHSSRLFESNIVVKSPGIHGDIGILKQLRARQIPVVSEIEFAADIITPQRIIAITGTNGKTTTTTLVGEIFKAARKDTVVAGNIGSPLADHVQSIDSGTSVILELSSYQLEDSPSLRPHISAILNITPDHLEHHHTMKNYIMAKSIIFNRQAKKDFCILNYDDKYCRRLARHCPAKVVFFSRKAKLKDGVYLDGDRIIYDLAPLSFSVSARLKIPGRHNIENALAAVAAAGLSGIKPRVIERTITGFKGVEHRIELCGDINCVKYYNDSKATNVDSTLVALESFSSPVWLILGGRDKGAPYTPLKQLIKKKVKGILLIGEAAPLIKRGLKGLAPFYECRTLANAVRKGRQLAAPGDSVLLSPACASFDQFKDYEDRGRQFKKLVKRLG